MTDVVTIGDATLYHGDCVAMVDNFDAHFEHFDLVLTDPPFGIGNFVQTGGNVRGEAVTWNDATPPEEFFYQLREVSTHRIIWGAEHFNCFEGCGALIWDKRQPMPSFSKAEIASKSWGKKTEIYRRRWTNFVNTKVTDHPCERPVDLYEWCLRQLPTKPKTVFDPFMGSGSCGVACVNFGSAYVGVERERKYFDIACERIEAAYAQGRLFA